MKKTIVVFGSSTGTCEEIANTTQLSQVNFPRSNSAYSCTNIACRCEFPQMASRISSL